MYLSAPNRSESAGVAEPFLPVSLAHMVLAFSIWRMLAMQMFLRLLVRALTKLGTAMAESRPTMATTIMISTRVNAECLFVLRFIFSFFKCLCLCGDSGFVASRSLPIAFNGAQHCKNGF